MANLNAGAVVPFRTPTHTGPATQATLSRTWILFFQGLAAASSGGGLVLAVGGTLAIGSDLAPRLAPLDDLTATAVTALVKNAPTGADLVIDVSYQASDGTWTVWMTLDLPAGETSVNATSAQISAAAAIPAGSAVRLDVTACGTTFPGSDLTVQIFY